MGLGGGGFCWLRAADIDVLIELPVYLDSLNVPAGLEFGIVFMLSF